MTHRGRAIGVILPVDGDEDAAQAAEAVDAATAWTAFLQAGRRVERRFATGASAVRTLTEMRR